MAQQEQRTLKVREVALCLGVSPSTARTLLKRESDGVSKLKLGAKQARTTYRATESVVERIKRKIEAGV